MKINAVAIQMEDDGLGGDEPFCQHGNLLWSEHCDECDKELWKISDAIDKQSQESSEEGK